MQASLLRQSRRSNSYYNNTIMFLSHHQYRIILQSFKSITILSLTFALFAKIVIGEREPNDGCQKPTTQICNIEKYQTAHPFTNILGHPTLTEAEAELHKYGYLTHQQPCGSEIRLFLCSLYVPVCVIDPTTTNRNVLRPCRDECEKARGACRMALAMTNQTWPVEWDCKNFRYQAEDKLCVIRPPTNQQDSNSDLDKSPNLNGISVK